LTFDVVLIHISAALLLGVVWHGMRNVANEGVIIQGISMAGLNTGACYCLAALNYCRRPRKLKLFIPTIHPVEFATIAKELVAS
jgi:hypothetical protein